jgi:putative tricarboxylic transport membrane protein
LVAATFDGYPMVQQGRTAEALTAAFGVVGYVFKKIGIPLAPLHAGAGARAEDAFQLSMIGSGGSMAVFWSNPLVGFITTLALTLLFWPVIDKTFSSIGRLMRPAKAAGWT